MATTNKWLLISESHSDSNRYTPCRGKPDQHDMYASYVSPHTPGVCFLRMVPVRGNLLRSHQQRWTEPLLLRKRAPDTIHRTPAVTPRVMKTLIKVISKGLGANTILNPKVEFKILV
jgi:hypothetical protein